jgi:hypothetical protein
VGGLLNGQQSAAARKLEGSPMTMPTDSTTENVKSWVLRTLADYDGWFTLDGDTFAKEDLPRNLWV